MDVIHPRLWSSRLLLRSLTLEVRLAIPMDRRICFHRLVMGTCGTMAMGLLRPLLPAAVLVVDKVRSKLLLQEVER